MHIEEKKNQHRFSIGETFQVLFYAVSLKRWQRKGITGFPWGQLSGSDDLRVDGAGRARCGRKGDHSRYVSQQSLRCREFIYKINRGSEEKDPGLKGSTSHHRESCFKVLQPRAGVEKGLALNLHLLGTDICTAIQAWRPSTIMQ